MHAEPKKSDLKIRSKLQFYEYEGFKLIIFSNKTYLKYCPWWLQAAWNTICLQSAHANKLQCLNMKDK